MPVPIFSSASQVAERQPPRKNRTPRHPFQLEHRPFEIVPFLIAPVLPGETMRNLQMQARVVSDPLRSKLVGWWCEYYFYYVKLRDLDGRDDFEEMMTNPDKSIAAYGSVAQDHAFNHAQNSADCIPWAKLCYQRVVEEDFRGDKEAWNHATFADKGYAVAQVTTVPGFLESCIAQDDETTVLDQSISTAGDNAFTIRELELAYQQFEMARANNLTQMDFEDYLEMSGVRGATKTEPHKPELIRFVRKWTYPTNTVEATDGSVATAVVWSIAERADKARFITEPGFLFGVTVVRPKVYYGNIDGSPIGFMSDMRTWLPPQLRNDARVGRYGFAAGAGPAGTGFDTEAYRYSVDDILLYGDQFLNFDPVANKDVSKVALPVDGIDLLNTRYPSQTDSQQLFADDVAGTSVYVRQDGIVDLAIASSLRDSIPGLPISD